MERITAKTIVSGLKVQGAGVRLALTQIPDHTYHNHKSGNKDAIF
jgi:hypothetical protein